MYYVIGPIIDESTNKTEDLSSLYKICKSGKEMIEYNDGGYKSVIVVPTLDLACRFQKRGIDLKTLYAFYDKTERTFPLIQPSSFDPIWLQFFENSFHTIPLLGLEISLQETRNKKLHFIKEYLIKKKVALIEQEEKLEFLSYSEKFNSYNSSYDFVLPPLDSFYLNMGKLSSLTNKSRKFSIFWYVNSSIMNTYQDCYIHFMEINEIFDKRKSIFLKKRKCLDGFILKLDSLDQDILLYQIMLSYYYLGWKQNEVDPLELITNGILAFKYYYFFSRKDNLISFLNELTKYYQYYVNLVYAKIIIPQIKSDKVAGIEIVQKLVRLVETIENFEEEINFQINENNCSYFSSFKETILLYMNDLIEDNRVMYDDLFGVMKTITKEKDILSKSKKLKFAENKLTASSNKSLEQKEVPSLKINNNNKNVNQFLVNTISPPITSCYKDLCALGKLCSRPTAQIMLKEACLCMECEEGCSLWYHQSCWKKHVKSKNEKYESICWTPDCGAPLLYWKVIENELIIKEVNLSSKKKEQKSTPPTITNNLPPEIQEEPEEKEERKQKEEEEKKNSTLPSLFQKPKTHDPKEFMEWKLKLEQMDNQLKLEKSLQEYDSEKYLQLLKEREDHLQVLKHPKELLEKETEEMNTPHPAMDIHNKISQNTLINMKPKAKRIKKGKITYDLSVFQNLKLEEETKEK